jgi:hypothetical protein
MLQFATQAAAGQTNHQMKSKRDVDERRTEEDSFHTSSNVQIWPIMHRCCCCYQFVWQPHYYSEVQVWPHCAIRQLINASGDSWLLPAVRAKKGNDQCDQKTFISCVMHLPHLFPYICKTRKTQLLFLFGNLATLRLSDAAAAEGGSQGQDWLWG